MKEITTVAVLLLLLLFILNPLHWWMPTMLQMIVLVGILVVFTLFATFVLNERAHDEREGLHRMVAGRMAFLAGAGVLTIAVVIQELFGKLDAWLVLALVVMILVKIGASLYTNKTN
jgi:cobalamin synthase